jgi:outer membrane lipoprotein-sorting protein
MVKTIRILFAVLFVVCLVQAGDAPDAENILARYVDATGGVAAYEKVKNRVTKSTLGMPAQGISMDMTIYHSRPNSLYSVIESEVTGKIEQGTDGEIAWQKTVMMGPRILEGQERDDILRQATFDQLVRWKDLYEKAEAAGTDEVDGRPCDNVILTPKTGKPQTYSFDRESGLLTKVSLTVENPMGVIPVVTYLEDYRSVDGLLVPFHSRVEMLGQERSVTVKSVEHNVELPADRFHIPADVLALVEK